mgnify:FL=1
MRHIAKALTLTAALCAMGCGSDDNNFSYGPFPNPTTTPINPPTAVADSFTTLGNSVLTGSVTANDTLNGATVTAFQNPSNSGGSVAITAGGQLPYTPPLNSANVNDTFTYTLTNSAGSSTATVTVQIGARGFFVKNDVTTTGTGTQSNPFKTLAEAVTAAGVNPAEIVVFQGDGTSTGLNTAVALATSQVLRAFDGNAPTLTGPVTMANNTTLSGVKINGSGNVQATGSPRNFTVQNCTISNTTSDGLAFTNVVGNVSLRNNALTNNGGRGLAVRNNAGLSNFTIANQTVNNSTTDGVLVNITNTANVTWSETNTTINRAGNGVAFAGNSWSVNTTQTSAFNATLTGCLSDSPSLFGLLVDSFNSSNVTLVFDQGIVRNGQFQGFLLEALDSSTFKARISNTQTNQNGAGFGFEADNGDFALMCLRLVNVTSDVYRLGNNNPSAPYNIENFAGFAAENTGSITQLGTINSVPIGSCGIP